MSVGSQQWLLFGFDLRNLFRNFLNAWKIVFIAQGSRLRNVLDEPVRLYCHESNALTEKIVGRFSGLVESEAHLLPDAMVLTKSINVPCSTSIDIASVVALEVNACSPFSAEDTTFGWRILSSTPEINVVVVAIVSKSAVMALVSTIKTEGDTGQVEVWAQVENAYVVLNGFGEGYRNGRYISRLKKMLGLLVICFLCIMGIFSVPVIYKYYEQQGLEAKYQTLKRESSDVVRIRSSLSDKNKTMKALNQLLTETPVPVISLDKITRLLADDVWLNRYEQTGKKVQIAGTAANAAQLMQQFSEHPYFNEVKAPAAIRKLGKNGLELFQLNFEVDNMQGVMLDNASESEFQ